MSAKKILALTTSLVLVILMTMGTTVFASYGRSYTAPKGTPTIDGDADPIWDNAEWTDVDKPYDGSDKASYPEELKIKLLWDESNLYFFAQVKDADINLDNDIVELYIDEDATFASSYDANDSQTRFRSDGTVVADSGTNCKNDAKAVGKATSDGFTVEGALPWTGSVKIAEGMTIGLELMYNVGDSSADFTQAFRWNADTAGGDAAPYASAEAWGKLILGAAPAPAVVEVVEETAAAEEAPAVEAAPTAVEAPAAQTSDFTVVSSLLLAAAIGGVMLVSKNRLFR